MTNNSFSFIYDHAVHSGHKETYVPLKFIQNIKLKSKSSEGNRKILTYSMDSNFSTEQLDDLTLQVAKSYVSPNSFADVPSDLSLESWIPSDSNRKVGDFGEIIATIFYKHILSSVTPLCKLRLKSSAASTLQGVDVFAIEYNQIGNFVPVEIEVKSRTSSVSLDLLSLGQNSNSRATEVSADVWKICALNLLRDPGPEAANKLLILDENFEKIKPNKDLFIIAPQFAKTFQDWEKVSARWPRGDSESRLILFEIPNIEALVEQIFTRMRHLKVSDVAAGVTISNNFMSIPKDHLSKPRQKSLTSLQKTAMSIIKQKNLSAQEVKDLILNIEEGEVKFCSSVLLTPLLWEYHGYHANAVISLNKIDTSSMTLTEKVVIATLKGDPHAAKKEDWREYEEFMQKLSLFWTEGKDISCVLESFEKCLSEKMKVSDLDAVAILMLFLLFLKVA